MSDAEAFGVLDINNDGVIDNAEWRNRKMIVFYLLDRNSDIHLTPNEVPRMADSEVAAIDANGDGRISGYEFNQATVLQFESADKDANGTVTLEEFKAFREGLAGG